MVVGSDGCRVALAVSGKQNRNIDLLDLVSIPAAADRNASLTVKRINL